MKRISGNTKKAIEFSRVYGLKQLIETTTHLNDFEGSCIDLIFTNCQFVFSSGVLNDVVSDQYPIYVCVKKPREVKKYAKIMGRSYNAYEKEAFCTLLRNDDWNQLYETDDPNDAWDIILNKMNTHLGIMCPIINPTG